MANLKDEFLSIFLKICKFSLWTVVLLTFYYIYKRTERNNNVYGKLPGLKLKFWQIFGHMRFPGSKFFATGSGPHSRHVYDFIAMVGYTKLFSSEGLVFSWQAHIPNVMFYRADIVKALLNHSTELNKSWIYRFLHNWLGTGLLTSEGQKWKQRRKLLTPTFHFDILKDFLPGLNNQSKILISVIQKEMEKPWINIIPFITRCSLDIICETTLGVAIQSQTAATSNYVEAVLELSESVLKRIYVPWYWPEIMFRMSSYGRQILKKVETVHNFTRKNGEGSDLFVVIFARSSAKSISYVFTNSKIISQKKKEKEMACQNGDSYVDDDDGVYSRRKRRALLDFLMEEHLNNNTFTEEDIREEVDTFTFEGHDTTSMAMSWALYLVGLYPEVQEKVQEELKIIFGDDEERPITMEDLSEMKYLENVLKESQRLYPSVAYFARDLQENLEVQNYTIPKGTTCGIMIYALHRDPTVFPNPEKFDPDRFLPENCEGRDPFAYIPFSAGPRNCIGQRFAMMELKTVLATVFRNFHVRSLDQRDKVQAVNNLILRSEGPIRIKFTKRTL